MSFQYIYRKKMPSGSNNDFHGKTGFQENYDKGRLMIMGWQLTEVFWYIESNPYRPRYWITGATSGVICLTFAVCICLYLKWERFVLLLKIDNQASLFVFNSWQSANNFHVFFPSAQFSRRNFCFYLENWKFLEILLRYRWFHFRSWNWPSNFGQPAFKMPRYWRWHTLD